MQSQTSKNRVRTIHQAFLDFSASVKDSSYYDALSVNMSEILHMDSYSGSHWRLSEQCSQLYAESYTYLSSFLEANHRFPLGGNEDLEGLR
jgi:hypothetical protein